MTGTVARETTREVRSGDGDWRLPLWERRWPGLVAGITGAEEDYGLTGDADAWTAAARFETLGRRLGFPAVVVGRQVHGAEVAPASAPAGGGVVVSGERDGHVTSDPDALLVVTAADCVPAYLLAPDRRAWGLVHAGWRGIAAGVLEAGIRALRARHGAEPGGLHLHLGPAICGECYEVGGEVLEALGESAAVLRPASQDGGPRVDLRGTLARRAAGAGLAPDRISRSTWCTCCSGDHFCSYRCKGESQERMAAFLGWREGEIEPERATD